MAASQLLTAAISVPGLGAVAVGMRRYGYDPSLTSDENVAGPGAGVTSDANCGRFAALGVVMKAGIVGGGGVGGYLGARLKLAGHDVGIVARGPNLAALREHGLHLKSPLGDARTGPLKASADPREIGPVDALFMTTKLYDLDAVASIAPALVGPSTLVIPVQNGVEAHEILTRALPGTAVLKATIYISSFLIAPGEILHKSPFCRLRVAATRPADEDGAKRLALVLSGVPGIEAAISPDIDLDLWGKFVMLASFAAVACVARVPIGQVLDHPALLAHLKAAMAETIAVARAKGIALPGDIESLTLDQMRQFPPSSKPSMLEDMEARRPLELEYLSGAIVRFGKALGVPTPVHEAAYRSISVAQPVASPDRMGGGREHG